MKQMRRNRICDAELTPAAAYHQAASKKFRRPDRANDFSRYARGEINLGGHEAIHARRRQPGFSTTDCGFFPQCQTEETYCIASLVHRCSAAKFEIVPDVRPPKDRKAHACLNVGDHPKLAGTDDF